MKIALTALCLLIAGFAIRAMMFSDDGSAIKIVLVVLITLNVLMLAAIWTGQALFDWVVVLLFGMDVLAIVALILALLVWGTLVLSEVAAFRSGSGLLAVGLIGAVVAKTILTYQFFFRGRK